MTDDGDELFDRPARWRADTVVSLGLTGDDRCAGATTSTGMPQLLRPAADALGSIADGPVLDVGGGLGAAASWLRSHTRRDVIVVEPSAESCRGARRLFDVPAIVGSAERLPVGASLAAAVVLNGVVSLVEDLAPAIREARRVLAPDGLIVVADLLARDATFDDGPNRFWSADRVADACAAVGVVVDICCIDDGAGSWTDVQVAVTDQIGARYGEEPGFEEWLADHERISALLDRGAVAGTAVVVRVG